MRQATQQVGAIEHGGRIVGINLGYDFTAEHEWGFTWASRYLGQPPKPTPDILGVKARTTSRVDSEFVIELVEHGGAIWLRGQRAWRRESETLTDELKAKKGSHCVQVLASAIRRYPVVSGWDGDSGFCVAATDETGQAAIRLVHEALLRGRCFIIQSGGLFGAGGLKLIDADLVPDKADKDLTATDLSALSLEEAVVASGIRDRLEAAGLRYFALSPRWENEAKRQFKFWLNPMDQNRNNCGWFTITDLDAWIAGVGPIPKKRAA